MPIEPPRLDDLRYDRLVEELIRRIPVHAPEWTDYNDSDPGITLIQLFAYLGEQVGYRLNRVPEKNHVELLKLLGVRLKAARAARTRLAFLLADPAATVATRLTRGGRARPKDGDPPPVFETDADLDVVPAEPRALLTTLNPYLWDLRLLNAATGQREPAPKPADLPAKSPGPLSRWHGVSWDGKSPKLKDLPLEPLPAARDSSQPYLWIGLDLNPALDAGFRGVRVTLSVQFDDDEQPRLDGVATCGAAQPAEAAPPPVTWLSYYDAPAGAMARVPGRIDDTTARFTRSGTLRFSVPLGFGPIPKDRFVDLVDAVVPSPQQGCGGLAQGFSAEVKQFSPSVAQIDLAKLQTALTKAVTDSQAAAQSAKPPVPHPVPPELRDPAKLKGWLRLGPLDFSQAVPRVRMLTFNAVAATHAVTVRNELLGRGDGRPGQELRLGHGNVLAGTLELGVQEESGAGALLVPWTEVDSLDGQDPFARVFELDREAGTLRFGDGRNGRIPGLVANGGAIVALAYRHGGGKNGEKAAGTITSLEAAAAGVSGVTNVVAATGGADAETLPEAKLRARKELSTRSRAVTAGDFEWIAAQTPEVRVARAWIVPLRRPQKGPVPAPPAARCGPPLPAGPLGLDAALVAHGAVSVVVVPDEAGPEPLPTPSFLEKVCRHLDRHRLVTTEVYVVPPQYARLCRARAEVKGAPGYTRLQLQEAVEARLARYLHVLTGGADGKGFPFGGQLHAADLVALVLGSGGIERVESFAAEFTRTRTAAAPRQGRLLTCPAAAGEVDRLDLAPDETASFDASTFTLDLVT